MGVVGGPDDQKTMLICVGLAIVAGCLGLGLISWISFRGQCNITELCDEYRKKSLPEACQKSFPWAQNKQVVGAFRLLTKVITEFEHEVNANRMPDNVQMSYKWQFTGCPDTAEQSVSFKIDTNTAAGFLDSLINCKQKFPKSWLTKFLHSKTKRCEDCLALLEAFPSPTVELEQKVKLRPYAEDDALFKMEHYYDLTANGPDKDVHYVRAEYLNHIKQQVGQKLAQLKQRKASLPSEAEVPVLAWIKPGTLEIRLKRGIIGCRTTVLML